MNKHVIIKAMRGGKEAECAVKTENLSPNDAAIEIAATCDIFGRFCADMWDRDYVMVSPLDRDGIAIIWRPVDRT